MIKNQAKYNQLAIKQKKDELKKLTIKESVKRLEELLSLHDFFNKKRPEQPLPLSLNRLLNLKS